MNVLSLPHTGAPAGVTLMDGPSAFEAFLSADCAAAVWNRRLPQDVAVWWSELPPDMLPYARVILRPEAVAKTMRQLCEAAELPARPERLWLEADVSDLAARFADMMQAPFLRLRLDVVITNACRKFHVDAIKARLVCTYRGTGTQYGCARDGADPEHIVTTPTGAPILLRGSLWPETPKSGLVHRSPPIEGTGETRLMVVLDPIHDPVDEV